MGKTLCAIEGCDRPLRARTWCNAHWKRWKRWGDPLGARPAAAGRCGKHNEEVVVYASGKRRCRSCHRADAMRQARRRGVRPQGKPGDNWTCGHDPVVMMRPNRNDCAECHREREKKRYAREADKQKRAVAEWVRRNRDRRNAYYRAWRAANTPTPLPPQEQRQAVEYGLILKGDPCAYCGAPFNHIDHIVPSARGGLGTWDNLTASCQPCNQSKQARSLLTFLLVCQDRATVDLR